MKDIAVDWKSLLMALALLGLALLAVALDDSFRVREVAGDEIPAYVHHPVEDN